MTERAAEFVAGLSPPEHFQAFIIGQPRRSGIQATALPENGALPDPAENIESPECIPAPNVQIGSFWLDNGFYFILQSTMRIKTLAALELLLISPALLFMAALLARYLSFFNAAQQIIDWYAHRMWTLWVLLLALPLNVLATGCAALRIQRTESLHRTPHAIYATTIAAGVIVVVVILHMLAN